MEDSKIRMLVVVFGIMAFTSLAISMIYMVLRPAQCQNRDQLSFRHKEDWDLHDGRLYIPEHDVLVVRTVLSERCYIVPNGKLVQTTKDMGHAVRVIRDPLSAEMLEHVAGQSAVEFCGKYPAYQATVLKGNDRSKRQAAPTGAPAASSAPVPAAASAASVQQAAAPAGPHPIRVINNLPNDCQDNPLIFCPDTVQETCTSGPGSPDFGGLYKVTVKCIEPTKFNAQIVTRCKENPDTKDDRVVKCMSKFVQKANVALKKLAEERAAQHQG